MKFFEFPHFLLMVTSPLASLISSKEFLTTNLFCLFSKQRKTEFSGRRRMSAWCEGAFVEDTEDCPFCPNLLFCWQCSKQTNSRGTSYHARKSLCFFANPCLHCGCVLRPQSFHRPNMLSAHDHRFPFWGMTVALNIDDSYPQQT